MAKEKKSLTLGIRRILLPAAAVVVLLLLAFAAGMLWGGQGRRAKITADLLDQQLREVSDLVTVEYRYTNMGKFENTLDFYGWEVPFTTKSFIVSYDGVIRAGVDLAEAAVEVSGDVVTVTLPAAEIFSNEVLEDSLEVYDETRNLFNPITIEDYTGFTADQKQSIEAKATENGLLSASAQRAETVVQEFLNMFPGMDHYTLEIKSGT